MHKRYLALLSLLLLQGCAVVKVASLAGKAGSAAKVATVAKVGLAAEGVAAASRAARGGEVVAVEAAGVSKVARAGKGKSFSQAGEFALNLSGIELPEGSTPAQVHPTRHIWRLSQGRTLTLNLEAGSLDFELRGFQGTALPKVHVTLHGTGGAQRWMSSPGERRFRFSTSRAGHSGGKVVVELRSGNQAVKLTPWFVPRP